MTNCLVCEKPDEQKPMCFRGEDYCSELHRKFLAGGVVKLTVRKGRAKK